jgi:hypothetical protein
MSKADHFLARLTSVVSAAAGTRAAAICSTPALGLTVRATGKFFATGVFALIDTIELWIAEAINYPESGGT